MNTSKMLKAANITYDTEHGCADKSELQLHLCREQSKENIVFVHFQNLLL